MNEGVLEYERRIQAPPEIVFAYFVDPERYTLWQGIGARLDPRPGGRYAIDYIDADGGVRGEYVLIDPPHRVVFTWGWNSARPMPDGLADVDPGTSTVEVTLEPIGDATLVRVRHAGLPTEAARELHGVNWPLYLERLETVIAGGDPGPDPARGLYDMWFARRSEA